MVEGITAEHKVFPKCLNFEIIQRRKISTKVFARGKGECGGLSAGNPLVLDSNVSSMDKTKQNKTKKRARRLSFLPAAIQKSLRSNVFESR